jgi:hypothetical protein
MVVFDRDLASQSGPVAASLNQRRGAVKDEAWFDVGCVCAAAASTRSSLVTRSWANRSGRVTKRAALNGNRPTYVSPDIAL